MSELAAPPPRAARAPRAPSALATAYLVAYNSLAALAWLYVDFLLLSSNGLAAPERVWPRVAPLLVPLQCAALLEVAHAALGLVPGSAATAFVQVFARLVVLLGFVRPVPAAQSSRWFLLMAAAWAAVEVPRYAFYVASTLDRHAAAAAAAAGRAPPAAGTPYVLKFLRYSLFLPLYPLGIAGELGCYFMASGAVMRDEPGLSLRMPNTFNVKLSHEAVMYALLALYPWGSWFMIGSMVKARAKALGGAAAEGEKQRSE